MAPPPPVHAGHASARSFVLRQPTALFRRFFFPWAAKISPQTPTPRFPRRKNGLVRLPFSTLFLLVNGASLSLFFPFPPGFSFFSSGALRFRAGLMLIHEFFADHAVVSHFFFMAPSIWWRLSRRDLKSRFKERFPHGFKGKIYPLFPFFSSPRPCCHGPFFPFSTA